MPRNQFSLDGSRVNRVGIPLMRDSRQTKEIWNACFDGFHESGRPKYKSVKSFVRYED